MKYRKKPVVIEAEQYMFGQSGPSDLITLLQKTPCDYYFAGESLFIRTLEGDMKADSGDWVIRGVKGECYPCKPDIFEATYEKVES